MTTTGWRIGAPGLGTLAGLPHRTLPAALQPSLRLSRRPSLPSSAVHVSAFGGDPYEPLEKAINVSGSRPRHRCPLLAPSPASSVFLPPAHQQDPDGWRQQGRQGQGRRQAGAVGSIRRHRLRPPAPRRPGPPGGDPRPRSHRRPPGGVPGPPSGRIFAARPPVGEPRRRGRGVNVSSRGAAAGRTGRGSHPGDHNRGAPRPREGPGHAAGVPSGAGVARARRHV